MFVLHSAAAVTISQEGVAGSKREPQDSRGKWAWDPSRFIHWRLVKWHSDFTNNFRLLSAFLVTQQTGKAAQPEQVERSDVLELRHTFTDKSISALNSIQIVLPTVQQ